MALKLGDLSPRQPHDASIPAALDLSGVPVRLNDGMSIPDFGIIGAMTSREGGPGFIFDLWSHLATGACPHGSLGLFALEINILEDHPQTVSDRTEPSERAGGGFA